MYVYVCYGLVISMERTVCQNFTEEKGMKQNIDLNRIEFEFEFEFE